MGLALPCAELRVMDEHGREVPAGESGELWIRGPMVVPGYWNNPEATRSSFCAGFWKSGDIGSIDRDGFVRVFDRLKDMLNRGGYKVFSVEVENVLAACPGVLESAIIGKPCPVLGERVHAFVSRSDPDLDEARLREFCTARPTRPRPRAMRQTPPFAVSPRVKTRRPRRRRRARPTSARNRPGRARASSSNSARTCSR